MKFGKYLDKQAKDEWRSFYLDYKGLKDLIKESARQAETSGPAAFSPRTTSLSIVRAARQTDAAEERFFQKLEAEVEKVGKFTDRVVAELRSRLAGLAPKADKAAGTPGPTAEKEQLMQDAKQIGEDYLQLEKYANLNYMGVHKILKKHDKMLPHAPCRQFYIAHLHQQPWVQGNYSDVLVHLSNCYSQLRGDTSGEKNEDSAQGFVRSTTKYWVRAEDVSNVKYHILQHLPVFQFEKNNFSGDAQLINSVYFDNENLELYHGRLDKKPGAIALRIRWYGPEPELVFLERKTHRESWKGEESVKERFVLPEGKVVPFLEMDYSLETAQSELRARGKSEKEVEAFSALFTEIRSQVDAKQLRPFIRTQYMRTAFQIPFDSTVRISMDTNLCMIKENPDEGPSCSLAGRWYRDPNLPISRNEITRFPHAVLEVKLSLNEGQQSPSWVQELLDSGYLTEVHKFSKFIHGTCTLFPELVQAVPYWVDDESVRPSMLLSAPLHGKGGAAAAAAGAAGAASTSTAAAGAAAAIPSSSGNGAHTAIEVADQANSSVVAVDKPRKRLPGLEDLKHPLLGDQPTLQLLPDRSQIRGFGGSSGGGGKGGGGPSWIMRLLGPRGPPPAPRPPGTTLIRIEPKTFLANERTFLSWLHMSVTIGSIAAALLGFSGNASGGGLASHLVEIIALILLPVAIAMCGYAIFVFIWRGQMISRKRPQHFDDRVGPLGLCAAVVTALTAILLVSIVDFIQFLESSGSGGDDPSPSPSPTPSPSPFPAPSFLAPQLTQLLTMAGGSLRAPTSH